MQEQEKKLPETYQKRQVRSFVMRTGRMTPSQKRAFDELWPRYGLAREQGLLDLPQVFGRNSDVVLEIGFGMGDSLIDMAKAAPEQDFIGIEVHTPGVGRLLNRAAEEDVNNIRVFKTDAVDVLENCIGANSLAKMQIFFPDPWHKKKHNKRRIIQPAFVQMLRRKLKPGGIIHLATDWEHYAEHMMEVMSAAEGFENCCGAGAFSPRPDFRPLTKFEQRGLRLGHGVWDLLFRKVS